MHQMLQPLRAIKIKIQSTWDSSGCKGDYKPFSSTLQKAHVDKLVSKRIDATFRREKGKHQSRGANYYLHLTCTGKNESMILWQLVREEGIAFELLSAPESPKWTLPIFCLQKDGMVSVAGYDIFDVNMNHQDTQITRRKASEIGELENQNARRDAEIEYLRTEERRRITMLKGEITTLQHKLQKYEEFVVPLIVHQSYDTRYHVYADEQDARNILTLNLQQRLIMQQNQERAEEQADVVISNTLREMNDLRKANQREIDLLNQSNRDELESLQSSNQRERHEIEELYHQQMEDVQMKSWGEVFERHGLEFNSMEDVDAVVANAVKYQQTLNDKERVVMGISIGCSILIMLFIFWVVSRCRGHRITSSEMEQALKAQREQIMRINEPLPVIPSVHAARLGVHEHPAVRDVFGMKKHYDVTAGEGFHVKRITKNGGTKGTTPKETEEGLDDVSNVEETDVVKNGKNPEDNDQGEGAEANLTE